MEADRGERKTQINLLIRSLLPVAFFCIPLAAQTPPPPEPVLRNLYFLEKQMKVWNLDKIEPLNRSIRAPFAADSWRASLTRPFDTAPVEGLPDPLGKRNMRNLTELILVARRPGLTPEKVRSLSPVIMTTLDKPARFNDWTTAEASSRRGSSIQMTAASFPSIARYR